MLDLFESLSPLYLGLIGSLVAGLGTGLGALPILFVQQITERVQGALLGFGAGVMLAATSFSLVIPSLEAATSGADKHQFTGATIVVIGILLGGAFLWFSHQYFPHEHFGKGPEGENLKNLKRIWLFVTAIAIHNFPEGLAVGVGFGGNDFANGTALTVGIGLQNLPEGFVVAIALLTENYSRLSAFGIALLTGLVEPLGGLIGVGIVSTAESILPWAMAFAAGAMLFVISDEIIPESHSLGHEKEATVGVMLGFVVMMFLDVTLS